MISESFSWLNRSRKTCLGWQCIIVVLCCTTYFITVRLFPKTVDRQKISQKMSFQETFDIIFIIIAIVHLLTVDKKMFHIIWIKKAN